MSPHGLFTGIVLCVIQPASHTRCDEPQTATLDIRHYSSLNYDATALCAHATGTQQIVVWLEEGLASCSAPLADVFVKTEVEAFQTKCNFKNVLKIKAASRLDKLMFRIYIQDTGTHSNEFRLSEHIV
jgi:hypothetical protein